MAVAWATAQMQLLEMFAVLVVCAIAYKNPWKADVAGEYSPF